MNKLTLKKVLENFKLEVLSGENKLDTEINVYGLNRVGLELSGFYNETGSKTRRLVLISSKESEFMALFSKEEKIEKYTKLMKSGIPGIIMTKKFEDDVIIKVAKELNFPILKSNSNSTSELSRRMLDYFDLFFAPSEELHGSLVNIYGKGVLIIGKSGIGKSEITIELIKKNHLFVGDDRIVITNKSNSLFGKSHEILKNLIEVRGIGILDVSKTNGYQVIMDETQLDIVIELFKFGENGIDDTDRLGNDYTMMEILGINVPYLRIPVSSGRNISNIVESAVAQLKIKLSGAYENPIDLINERINTKTKEG